MSKKFILELTVEEFNEFISDNLSKIEFVKNLLEQGLGEIKYEINNLQDIERNYQAGRVGVLSVAGILSLFIFFIQPNDLLGYHFFTFVFPFLVVAIIIHIFAFKILNPYREYIAIGTSIDNSELLILRGHVLVLQDTFILLVNQYQKKKCWNNRRWNKIFSIFLKSFILSFFVSLFFFYFKELPSKPMMFVIIADIFTGVVLFDAIRLKSSHSSADTGLKIPS